MNDLENTRRAVIGVGFSGEIHAGRLATMPGIELTALSTRRPDRLAELAGRHSDPGCFADYRELLADKSIAAVSITAHMDGHRGITIGALRAELRYFAERVREARVQDRITPRASLAAATKSSQTRDVITP